MEEAKKKDKPNYSAKKKAEILSLLADVKEGMDTVIAKVTEWGYNEEAEFFAKEYKKIEEMLGLSVEQK